MIWSPRAFREARARMAVAEQEREAAELQRAQIKELAAANKLYQEKIAQEKRKQRVREKEERERVKAKKAEEAAERKAQRERDKQACDAEKAVQLPQRGKRKALQSAAPGKTQNRGTVAARRGVIATEPPAAPRADTTRSGRTATLYN